MHLSLRGSPARPLHGRRFVRAASKGPSSEDLPWQIGEYYSKKKQRLRRMRDLADGIEGGLGRVGGFLEDLSTLHDPLTGDMK